MTPSSGNKLNASRYQPVSDIEVELCSRLPWLARPAFKINGREGFDGTAFGARSGPFDSQAVTPVIHEISHALEITLLPEAVWTARIRKPDFDLRIRTVIDTGDELIYEPVTLQATQRECRVGGIQLRLMEAAGYDTSGFIERYVLVLRHMDDSTFGGSCPRNTPNPKDYTRQNWKWVAKRRQWVHDAYHAFSLPELQDRWDAVMEQLALPRSPANSQAGMLELIAA